ncbi:MAG: Na(+)/H(+) antiporter subunit B [Bacilli bacterium]|nr:Na(+)/H(+) antiporter subunit B [Bacilli bacterium]MBN2877327.1 Na(+)/H(+) antiporter subunit B [Bacilli bacterium]
MKNVFGFLISVALGIFIILALANTDAFPAFGDVDLTERISNAYLDINNVEQVGSANLVTAIVVGYRGFDTLGEVTVLFISALGVAFIFGGVKQKRLDLDFKPNFMLRVGSNILFGIILVTSFYIILHGHLTPGGGFPGGAIIASAVLLLYLADDRFRSNVKGFKVLEGVAGSIFVVIGLLGLVFATAFLENFLPAGTVGNLISAGIIPVIYVLIGLKVGSEIAGIVDNFLTEEESA